jgi:hypothetical protein
VTGEIDRSPARISTAFAVGAAFVATASGGLVSTTALAVAMAGTAGVFLALYLGSRRILSVGVIGLFLGAMVSGLDGATSLTVLASVTAGALTWDYGTTAISVGRQLGRQADTARAEKTHALASAGVAVATIAVSVGIYRSITGTHPVAAVFFLLLAAVLLVGTLR